MYRPSPIAMYFTNIKGIFTELPQPPLHSTPGVFFWNKQEEMRRIICDQIIISSGFKSPAESKYI